MSKGVSILSNEKVSNVSSTLIEGADDQIIALQYPMSMNSVDEQWNGAPVLMFTIYSYNATSFNQLKKNAVEGAKTSFMPKTKAVIMLPMPSNGLNDSVNNNIGAGDNTFLQEVVGNGFAAFQSGSGAMDTMKKTGNAVFGTLKTEAGVMADKATKAYNTQRGAGQTIAGNRGFHAYNGTDPRSFTFNWRFYPKNLAELKTISNIIQVLREASVGDPKGDPNGYIVSKAPPIVAVQERILGVSDWSKIRFTPRFGTGEAQISNLTIKTGSDGLYTTLAGTAGDSNVFDIEVTIKELLQPTAAMFRELAQTGSFATSNITPRRTDDGLTNYGSAVSQAMNENKK